MSYQPPVGQPDDGQRSQGFYQNFYGNPNDDDQQPTQRLSGYSGMTGDAWRPAYLDGADDSAMPARAGEQPTSAQPPTSAFARLIGRVRGWSAGRRALLIAAICAVCLIAIGGSALAFALNTATPPHTAQQATFTETPTVTLAPTLTATATHVATKSPTHSVPKTPPAPAPTPPPNGNPTTQFCPTPTPGPTATPTPSPTATATATVTPGASPTATSGTSATSSANAALSTCTPCPYYKGNNPSQSAIQSALISAATLYHLPRNLLMAVAWQESRWHEDVTSCDGGIGLMQIQYYTYPWLNGQSIPACNLGVTSYDPYTLQGNADLGAKYLKWLSCFYSYWGDDGGSSPSSPGAYTIAWYYQQAGLQYPDTKNADGSANPKSFCAAVFNDPSNSYYPDLPSTTAEPWSCPYSATTGDNPLLDMTLSAYNEGAGYTDQYGIQNEWYVQGVEGWIPQFANGSLPA